MKKKALNKSAFLLFECNMHQKEKNLQIEPILIDLSI